MNENEIKKRRIAFLVMRSHFGTDRERTRAIENENDIEILESAAKIISEDKTPTFSLSTKKSFAARLTRKAKRLKNTPNE